jgi:hypothetical protein
MIAINSKVDYLGNCTDEELVIDIFGSVTNLATLIEQDGNEFIHQGVMVKYNDDTDIHSFYRV